jgi:DnaK suppressor protein
VNELTPEEVRELGQVLTALRDELGHVLKVSEAGTRPVDLDEPIGRLSRMDAMQQQSMARANRQTAELRLKQVNGALARFSKGEYGDCRECEEPIGHARLRVRPEAALCIACQSQRER